MYVLAANFLPASWGEWRYILDAGSCDWDIFRFLVLRCVMRAGGDGMFEWKLFWEGVERANFWVVARSG